MYNFYQQFALNKFENQPEDSPFDQGMTNCIAQGIWNVSKASPGLFPLIMLASGLAPSGEPGGFFDRWPALKIDARDGYFNNTAMADILSANANERTAQCAFVSQKTYSSATRNDIKLCHASARDKMTVCFAAHLMHYMEQLWTYPPNSAGAPPSRLLSKQNSNGQAVRQCMRSSLEVVRAMVRDASSSNQQEIGSTTTMLRVQPQLHAVAYGHGSTSWHDVHTSQLDVAPCCRCYSHSHEMRVKPPHDNDILFMYSSGLLNENVRGWDADAFVHWNEVDLFAVSLDYIAPPCDAQLPSGMMLASAPLSTRFDGLVSQDSAVFYLQDRFNPQFHEANSPRGGWCIIEEAQRESIVNAFGVTMELSKQVTVELEHHLNSGVDPDMVCAMRCNTVTNCGGVLFTGDFELTETAPFSVPPPPPPPVGMHWVAHCRMVTEKRDKRACNPALHNNIPDPCGCGGNPHRQPVIRCDGQPTFRYDYQSVPYRITDDNFASLQSARADLASFLSNVETHNVYEAPCPWNCETTLLQMAVANMTTGEQAMSWLGVAARDALNFQESFGQKAAVACCELCERTPGCTLMYVELTPGRDAEGRCLMWSHVVGVQRAFDGAEALASAAHDHYEVMINNERLRDGDDLGFEYEWFRRDQRMSREDVDRLTHFTTGQGAQAYSFGPHVDGRTCAAAISDAWHTGGSIRRIYRKVHDVRTCYNRRQPPPPPAPPPSPPFNPMPPSSPPSPYPPLIEQKWVMQCDDSSSTDASARCGTEWAKEQRGNRDPLPLLGKDYTYGLYCRSSYLDAEDNRQFSGYFLVSAEKSYDDLQESTYKLLGQTTRVIDGISMLAPATIRNFVDSPCPWECGYNNPSTSVMKSYTKLSGGRRATTPYIIVPEPQGKSPTGLSLDKDTSNSIRQNEIRMFYKSSGSSDYTSASHIPSASSQQLCYYVV